MLPLLSVIVFDIKSIVAYRKWERSEYGSRSPICFKRQFLRNFFIQPLTFFDSLRFWIVCLHFFLFVYSIPSPLKPMHTPLIKSAVGVGQVNEDCELDCKSCISAVVGRNASQHFEFPSPRAHRGSCECTEGIVRAEFLPAVLRHRTRFIERRTSIWDRFSLLKSVQPTKPRLKARIRNGNHSDCELFVKYVQH